MYIILSKNDEQIYLFKINSSFIILSFLFCELTNV